MSPSDPRERFLVPQELDGARLDVVLARHVRDRSRTRLQSLVREGLVTVDDVPVTRPNTAVAAGSRIALDLPEPRAPAAPVAGAGERAPLDVLYEDEALIVVDKPAGLVVHRNDRYPAATLADMAVAQFGELPSIQGEHRPGIAHRLDRLTSGVLLLGRTTEALEAIKAQFQARTVAKTYLALVHGDPRFDSDWIETSIGPSADGRGRFKVVPEGEGRAASTYYEVRERFHGFAYVELRPRTGRTHQLRVHLHSIGLPIVGDWTYKHAGALKVPLPAEAPPMDRQALHAHRIELDHPVTGKRVSFESPLPGDIETLLDWLRTGELSPGAGA
ncbi:MAG: RluA family pseudouridine synthase [Planctomycetota bacterium]|nr:MAG: RluA family pseudouridine synthase [Planctomycetota bacterium]